SESDEDMEHYIPPLPYGAFKDWEIVRCPLSTTYYHVYYQENRRQKSFFYLKQLLPHVYREDLLLLRRRMNRYFRLNPDVDVGLDLWRDVNLLCQSLHSDDVEDFWRTQDEWIVSSWKLYPKSSVHVLDLTNGTTVYMFVDRVYPIRATLLERMLRHKLTVPPSYCRDVVIAGNIIQTVQDGLRQAYECLASAPISPWLTAKKESGSPLQTALVCNSNPLIATFSNPLMVARLPKTGWYSFSMFLLDEKWLVQEGTALELASPEQTATGKDVSNPLYGCDGLPKTVRVFQFTLDSRSEKLDWLLLHQDWKLLFFDDATSFDSAVHRVHAVSFDAAVLDAAAPVSAACIIAAGYIVSAGVYDAAVVPAGSSSSIPADYVSAGHVLINSRASAQKKDAQPHKTTKRYIPVEKKSDSKNHGRQIPIGQRFSPNKSSNVYLKTTPPRSGLTWKPTGRIFTYVGLRWIPTGKTVRTCLNINDSAIPLGNKTSSHNRVICANASSLSAVTNGNPSSVIIKQYYGSAETEEDLSKSFSPAWLTMPSWMMSISLTEVEMKCFTSTSKELPLLINAKRVEELSYLLNKLNRIAEAEALVLVIREVPQTLEYRGGQLNVAPLLEDFQDSLDNEEDTRRSQEYLNDLEEEYQARALLAKSKRLSKRGVKDSVLQKQLKILNATNVVDGHFVRDCFSKTSVPSFPSPNQNHTQPKLTSSSHHKIESKYFEAKCNKVNAKLALLSPGASASSSTLVKNKGLIVETYEWDAEDVSSDDNKVMEVKALMALAEEERVSVSKESYNTKASISGVERPWLSKTEGFILPNHDTGRILPAKSQRNSIDPLVVIIDSLETEYDLADESSVCSTFFPPLEKPGDAESVSGPKTVKTTLKSISTLKTEALKGIIPNEPSLAPAQENKKASASKSNSAPAENSKNVKTTDNLHLATVIKELSDLKLQVRKN
ncbi:hypothetical protein Tco_0938768, partial [Tanacetum coccineum]